jgi:hypothetical protein
MLAESGVQSCNSVLSHLFLRPDQLFHFLEPLPILLQELLHLLGSTRQLKLMLAPLVGFHLWIKRKYLPIFAKI